MPQGDTTVEGYRVYVGVGEESFGRALYDAVPAADIPALIAHLFQVYQAHRRTSTESFGSFVNRYPIADLQQLFG
jgi:ferredoxin-nitrite reductase